MASSCDKLLHPELMSNEELLLIIEERRLRVPNLHTMQRDKLLSIFHNFCVPYGQRKYKDTGRGKVLNKNRNSSPESPSKLNAVQSINNWHNLKTKSKPDDEKLNPPPDLLSGHIKRIKLDVNLVKENDNFKRKVPVCPDNEDCTPPKKDRKLITWP
ncbi:unnamed protein product [Pieris macdunnoughi]|uniref:Ashwin n=1 Tax=Pieris macdunnoughi TaxID=345717 RepID=A0A821S3B5_9NEOP|nr:unnamed protein product [Pieris macdunnoughi]